MGAKGQALLCIYILLSALAKVALTPIYQKDRCCSLELMQFFWFLWSASSPSRKAPEGG